MKEEKIGKLLGFSKRWYPLSNDIFVCILVENCAISIPIDHRQRAYIEKEYPIDSDILLTRTDDGEWHILSRHLNPVTLKKSVIC